MDLHRVIDAPLLMEQRAAASMLLTMTQRARGIKTDDEAPAYALQTNLADTAPIKQAVLPRAEDEGRSFQLVNGVAVIPISGVLAHGVSNWEATGYSTLSEQILNAAEDREARAIALQIASPGGEVSGLFELTDTITTIIGDKPVWAILDDHAYSAAYAIASTADHVTVPRTGGTGSIGVVTMHADMSKFLEMVGVSVTIVQYGEHKTDYSPFKQLSEEAKALLQADVNAVGELFTKMVAKNRGLSHTRVRSTEARIFMGNDGVENGLVDAVMSPLDAFSALVRRVS